MLSGKKILLGVTGSIAAYKSAFLTRLLVKAGAEVRVVMTPSSKDFIGALSLSTLSKNPVEWEFVDDKEAGTWNNHVELGLWADLFLIAPCSANTLAKMASGICDNLLMAVYLSAKCPVAFAPAMDRDMIKHNTTQENIQKLVGNGNILIEPESGELASGLEGEGRMAEPEQIVDAITTFFKQGLSLNGKKVMITAGPTFEPIDPVRFIGNRSSGKMGYAIAKQCIKRGGEVTLVSGPSNLEQPSGLVDFVSVQSAQDMYDACMQHRHGASLIVMSAAVADYSPDDVSDVKMKKKDAALHLDLKPTKDILKELSSSREKGQIIVGFALETNDGLANAQKKLEGKALDVLVLNSLEDKGSGFGVDTNKVTILDRDNNQAVYELKDKSEVAKDIIDYVEAHFDLN